MLVADCWFHLPDGTGPAQLTFSTGRVAWHEPMLELFDALATSAHWR